MCNNNNNNNNNNNTSHLYSAFHSSERRLNDKHDTLSFRKRAMTFTEFRMGRISIQNLGISKQNSLGPSQEACEGKSRGAWVNADVFESLYYASHDKEKAILTMPEKHVAFICPSIRITVSK